MPTRVYFMEVSQDILQYFFKVKSIKKHQLKSILFFYIVTIMKKITVQTDTRHHWRLILKYIHIYHNLKLYKCETHKDTLALCLQIRGLSDQISFKDTGFTP